MKKHILKENYDRLFGKREFGDPLHTFKGVMEKHKINEQQALFPIRVDMKVDFTDNETTEESFIEDIEKAIQGVIDTSGVNVEWTVNDDSMG
jgi:hypothetical protein